MDALVLFAKFPEPGKVKKKIGSVIGMDASAGLCSVFIQDLISKHSEKDYDMYLSFIGKEHKDKYRQLFPSTILYVQRGTNLGENLQYAFADLLDAYSKVVVIGCDVPYLGSESIKHAFNALDFYDVVLGPADDGGFYLIGLKQPAEIFDRVPWGGEEVLSVQLKNIEGKKLSYVLLDRLKDVDTIEELNEVRQMLKKEDAPHTYEFLKKLRI